MDISTTAGLSNIRNAPAGSYRLTADIDLSSISNWVPIGTTIPFTGTLDGGDHTIRNLTIANTQTSNQGLFGVIGGTGFVSNLKIEGARVTAADSAGILAGVNQGTLSRVSAEGIISGATTVGGLVGTNSGTITNAFAIAMVSGRNVNGGLVGENTGALTNVYAASSVSAAVTNKFIQFDGIDDYISIPDALAYEDMESFTIEAWFQWTAENRTAVSFITGKGYENFEIHTGGGSGENGIRFIPLHNSLTITGGASAYQDVHNVLQPGWNHVATTWDYPHKQVRVFLNGLPQDIYQNDAYIGKVASIPLISPGNNPLEGNRNDLFIGARNQAGPQSYFTGNISDVRFWNTVRTADQIAADKYKQLTGTEDGLIGYWKLDEISNGKVNDSSPTNNDGTLVGSPKMIQETSINGGLVAVNTGLITYGYYDSGVSALSDTGKGVPLTSEQMKTPGQFTGWNFVNVWKINPGYTYPTLFTHTAPVSITAVSPTPALTGQSYTVSVAVGPHYIGSPTGSVTVNDGGSETCSEALTPGSPSSVSCSLSALSVGTKTLTASYPGDSIFANSSAARSHAVQDGIAPTVTVEQASTQADPSAATPVNFTATFNEPISPASFTPADVTLSGAAGPTTAVISQIAPHDDTTFNIAVSGMTSLGTVIASIEAGEVQDLAGNGSAASTSTDNQVTFNVPAPAVSAFSATSPSGSLDVSITAFTVAQDTFVNGYLITLSAALPALDNPGWSASVPTTYTVPGDGAYTLYPWAKDQFGNISALFGSPPAVVADSTPPITTITATPANPATSASASFTFVGSDASGTGVTGFACSLDGSSFSACTSPKSYTSLGEGSHTFQVRATDAVNHADATPAAFTWTVDTVAPDTTITQRPSDPTPAASASFSFTGTDTGGTGVASFACSLDGASFSTCPSPQSYTALGDGSHTFQVRAVDAAGNADATPAAFTWTVDGIGPSVTITSTAPNPTSASPIPVSVQFSEAVTGFTAADLTLVNGTLDNFAGTGGAYSFDLAPSGQGLVTVEIAPGAAADAAGNANPAAAFSRTYDSLAPTVTIDQAAGQADPTNGSPVNFTVVFSEPVSGFTSGEVTLSGTAGATTATVSGEGTTYNVAVSGMTTGGTVIATLGSNLAQDAASNGNSASTSSDNTVTFTLETTTGLSTSPNPAVVGQVVSLTATVTSAEGALSGAVEFFDGATSLGSSVLDAGGQAVFSTSALALGSHNLTARYLGSSPYNASTSPVVIQTIEQAQTTTTLATSASPSGYGASVTLTAAVSVLPPGSGTPGGAVEFFDGATSLGSAVLDAGGQAAFSTSALALGSHNLTARYLGSSPYNASTSPVVIQTIEQAQTTTTLATSASPSGYGASVTLTAAVSVLPPGSGTPGGAVEFFDGATSLGSAVLDAGGQAAFSTSALAVGSHTIFATYGGDTDFSGSQAPGLTQLVDDLPGVSRINSVLATSNGEIVENESTNVAISQLLVIFTKAMDADSAQAPANYRLVRDGATDIVIDGVTYVAGANTALVDLNGGVALSDGTYTLSVAGALRDTLGTPIGADFVRTFSVDQSVPKKSGLLSLADQASLEDGMTLSRSFSQIRVAFDEDVYDPDGDSDPGDVTNPHNYLLVSTGGNGSFDTVTCAAGLAGDDTRVDVGPVTYLNNGGAGPFVATVQLNQGALLANGRYQFFVCGSTSIVDLSGNPLNSGVDDTTRFTILSLAAVEAMPATGFAPGVLSRLPEQPAGKTYRLLGDLWIEIPVLQLAATITGVPLEAQGWDVTWLHEQVGWLEGTAYPTWPGNTVLTAHRYTADGRPGPFASLTGLKYGDSIVIHSGGMTYRYAVRSSAAVEPDHTYWLTRHEERDWITLITCQQYDEKTHTYRYRQVVRAVLVSVAEE